MSAVQSLLKQYRQSALDCEPIEANGSIRMTPDRNTSHHHAAWMIDQMLAPDWDWSNENKTSRWLGFIQSVLWTTGVFSISQLRDQARGL